MIMKSLTLEMGWENNPLSTDGNANPVNLSLMPFGVIIAAPNGTTTPPPTTPPSEGGSNFNFSVQELDLQATATATPVELFTTPDMPMQTVTRVGTKTTVEATSAGISAFFEKAHGTFSVSLDTTTSPILAFFFNVAEMPTKKFTTLDMESNPNAKGIAFQLNNGSLVIMSGGVTGNGSNFVNEIKVTDPVETIDLEIVDDSTIKLYHKGELIQTAIFDTPLLDYFVIPAEFPMPMFTKLEFDFSAYNKIAYHLPTAAKDGDIYHLTSGGSLFGKELQTNDYIQVYNGKQNVTVLRVPKPLPVPKPTRIPLEVRVPANITSQLKAWWDTELDVVFISGGFMFTSLKSVAFTVVLPSAAAHLDFGQAVHAYSAVSGANALTLGKTGQDGTGTKFSITGECVISRWYSVPSNILLAPTLLKSASL